MPGPDAELRRPTGPGGALNGRRALRAGPGRRGRREIASWRAGSRGSRRDRIDIPLGARGPVPGRGLLPAVLLPIMADYRKLSGDQDEWRGRVGDAPKRPLAAVRPAHVGADCRQGHQPPRGRGHEGVPGVSAFSPGSGRWTCGCPRFWTNGSGCLSTAREFLRSMVPSRREWTRTFRISKLDSCAKRHYAICRQVFRPTPSSRPCSLTLFSPIE